MSFQRLCVSPTSAALNSQLLATHIGRLKVQRFACDDEIVVINWVLKPRLARPENLNVWGQLSPGWSTVPPLDEFGPMSFWSSSR